MRRIKVKVGSYGNNAMRVDMSMTFLIMVFNLEEVSGLFKPRCLVEISQVSPDVGVVHDTLLVTLLIVMTIIREQLHK